MRWISAGSPRGVDVRPGPAARASAAAAGADTGHVNGDPGTACPLNRTDRLCGAASTGLKFTCKIECELTMNLNRAH